MNIDLNFESFSKGISENNKVALQKLRNELNLEKEINKLIHDLKALILKNNIEIDRLFQKLDLNENSFIEIHEFTKLIENIDGKIRPELVRKLFERFDINGDQKISLSEFKKFLTSNSLKKDELCSTFFEKLSQ